MPTDEAAVERENAGLFVEGVAVREGAQSHDVRLEPGEIVGLAELEGQGQEAFLETLAGLRAPAEGKVFVGAGHGKVAVTNFRQAVRHGIAYLARDRRSNGIFPALSILDNFAMVSMGRDTRLGIIATRERRRRYEVWRERLDIVAGDPRASITSLSGGNQQKVLLARWLALGPRVLLLNDPTRGVDHRTRETLYGAFRELVRNQGLALMMVSTEIEETLRLCDRVLVFRDQAIVASLSEANLTNERMIAAMFGQQA